MKKAKHIRINPDNFSSVEFTNIINCILQDGVLIYPTDTVYAMGCSIQSKKAIERIARIKNIKLKDVNFSLIFNDFSQLSNYIKPVSNPIFKGIKKVIPGPYTFVFESNKKISKFYISKNKIEIGIRIPNHVIPREIVRQLNFPLVTTSIHHEDEIIDYITDPILIYEQYCNDVDIIIDGGFGNNIPSTIVDCTNDYFEILREGLGDISILQ